MASQQQYVPLGQTNAPAAWPVPDTLDLVLETVFAHFDGSSAASAYLPTLQIISDSGHTLAEIPMDASVAAGASVEATWAPFLRGAAAAGGGAAINGAYGLYNTASTSVPAGGTITPAWVYAFGQQLLDLTNPANPTVFTAGLYWIGVSFIAAAPWTAGAGMECHFGMTPVGPQATAMALADTFLQRPEGFVAQTLKLAPGDKIYAQLLNHDTAARSLAIQEADVVLLAT